MTVTRMTFSAVALFGTGRVARGNAVQAFGSQADGGPVARGRSPDAADVQHLAGVAVGCAQRDRWDKSCCWPGSPRNNWSGC
jgi:hypothetical protein